MAKFRKKPIVIEAIQVPAADAPAEEWWNLFKLLPLEHVHRGGNFCGQVEITTLEGIMVGIPGDWIIKGIKGEFYPCKPDIFAATYELAD